jgi:hypothetical protein
MSVIRLSMSTQRIGKSFGKQYLNLGDFEQNLKIFNTKYTMITQVDQIGQRKNHEWRLSTNFSLNHSRKLWLQIVKLKVSKSLSLAKIVLYERGSYILGII